MRNQGQRVPWQGGWAGAWAGSSPACANNLLLSPNRDGMCWEIRQRYLPAQARGRFLLKGEGGRAGGGAGTMELKPPLLLSAAIWDWRPSSQCLSSRICVPVPGPSQAAPWACSYS